MCNRNLTDKEHTLWLGAALASPIVQTASGCSWVAVASVVILCLSIRYGMERVGVRGNAGRWLGAVQWLWMLLVISEFMHWSEYCWPGDGTERAVPVILLALAAYSVTKGIETAARTGRVIRWPILFLFGTVLLSGLKEVKLSNLRPRWEMHTASLITAMLIPVMGIGYGAWKGKRNTLVYALSVSAICTGVLSLSYIQRIKAPFYELGRSVTLLGVGQRFESLVAAGMTLGYYVLFSYLIGITAKAWEPEGRRLRSIWISAAFAAAVYISGMRMNSRLLAMGNLAIWVALPVLKIIAKNMKKTIDK